jgi:uncharacterized protein (TIGR00369 family)
MTRDLRMTISRESGGFASLPIVPEILEERGAVRAGVLATLVDVYCGGLALEIAEPNWLATLDLSLHLCRPLSRGHVVARGSVLRAGRQTIVLEVALADDAGTEAGMATMTYAILPRRADTPVHARDFSAPRTELGGPGSGLAAPFADSLGIRVVDAAAGRAEIEMSDYVRNSLSALQGGAARHARRDDRSRDSLPGARKARSDPLPSAAAAARRPERLASRRGPRIRARRPALLRGDDACRMIARV